MSILIHDAKVKLQADLEVSAFETLKVHDILYADDTLLIAQSKAVIESYMQCIGECGKQYGMVFNRDKLECMNIRCDVELHNEVGDIIQRKDSLKYLGSILAADGHSEQIVASRLGMAKQEFSALAKFWQHAAVSNKKKYHIYEACVLSKLMYGLESIVLSSASLRKINGFHVSCCRKILRISASYISRVSNKYILQQLDTWQLSTKLLQRQMLFMGTIARSEIDILRNSVFKPGSLELIVRSNRRRGRPRTEWSSFVWKHCCEAAGQDIEQSIRHKSKWARVVKEYCKGVA